MARKSLLSQIQQDTLFDFPDQSDEHQIIKYYTLTTSDLVLIKQKRYSYNRLGYAIQLCCLRYPGIPFSRCQVPFYVVEYVSKQLRVQPEIITQYLRSRDETKRDHFLDIQKRYGYLPFNKESKLNLYPKIKEVALSTIKTLPLFQTCTHEMRKANIIFPVYRTIETLIKKIQSEVESEITLLLTKDLSNTQKKTLDNMIRMDGTASSTSFISELRKSPGRSCPANILALIQKLERIRDIGLASDLSKLVHINHFTWLAKQGSKYSIQHLRRFDDNRRYSILVAHFIEQAEFITDIIIEMHDKVIGQMFNDCYKKYAETMKRTGSTLQKTVKLYSIIGKAIIQAQESNIDIVKAIKKEIKWNSFKESVYQADEISRTNQSDPYDFLQEWYPQIRRYAPLFLKSFIFRSALENDSLLSSIHALRSDFKRQSLPESIDLDFIKPKWKKYVISGNRINMTYFRLFVLSELKNSLRSGDMWIEGSKQFKNFESYLIPQKKWVEMTNQSQIPINVPLDTDRYLSLKKQELNKKMELVCNAIQDKTIEGISIKNGRLSISRLQKNVPEEVDALVRKIYKLLPRVKLTNVIVEVDQWTDFTRWFTHLNSGDPVKNKLPLYSNLLAMATNMGITQMSESCPDVSLKELIWVSDWYIREDTYSKALAEINNFHHKTSFSKHYGDGTTSSSDGQAFNIGSVRQSSAEINPKYGSNPTLTFYTHISDQYSPFHTKVIHSTVRDATHVLDGLLYHESDLDIKEHYTDTSGYTDHVFALCSLLGFRFAPRLRDIHDRKLFVFDKQFQDSELSSVIDDKIDINRLKLYWDHVLRLVSSIKSGTVSASLIIKKLASYPRQNKLAWALRELGKIDRTIFILDWILDPQLRRRVQIGLNKGEAKNALARALYFYRLGEVRDRTYEMHQHRASGLNLVVSAIILWNTVYIEKAVNALRQSGEIISDELLKHISPLGWDHISLTGEYTWDIKRESLNKNFRPLNN